MRWDTWNEIKAWLVQFRVLLNPPLYIYIPNALSWIDWDVLSSRVSQTRPKLSFSWTLCFYHWKTSSTASVCTQVLIGFLWTWNGLRAIGKNRGVWKSVGKPVVTTLAKPEQMTSLQWTRNAMESIFDSGRLQLFLQPEHCRPWYSSFPVIDFETSLVAPFWKPCLYSK